MIDKVDMELLRDVIAFYGLSNLDNTPTKPVEIPSFFYEDIKMDKNLSLWAKNKEHLFNLFGEKLKIEISVENLEPTEEEIENDICNRIFSESNSNWNYLTNSMFANLSVKEIANNRFDNDFYFNSIKIGSAGGNISKAIRLLSSDKAYVRKAQDLYSEIIQQSKGVQSGTLVISIDPVDFLTMSCSSSGWASCHHPNRGYGFGGVAYMCDKSSVIVYLKGSKDIKLTAVDGNMKKDIYIPDKQWRQIALINTELKMSYQLKQYPSKKKSLNMLVSEEISKLLSKGLDDREKILKKKYSLDNYFKGNFTSTFLGDGPHLTFVREEGGGYYSDISSDNFDYGIVCYPTDLRQRAMDYEDAVFTVGENCFYFNESQTPYHRIEVCNFLGRFLGDDDDEEY